MVLEAPAPLHALHRLCLELAQRSDDRKRRYGALLIAGRVEVREQLYGCGWNYLPAGYACADCPHYRTLASGTRLGECYAIHAEQAALADAVIELGGLAQRRRHGLAVPRLTMVFAGLEPRLTAGAWDWHPILVEQPIYSCSYCARIMVAHGIDEVLVPTTQGPVRLDQATYLRTAFAVASGQLDAQGRSLVAPAEGA